MPPPAHAIAMRMPHAACRSLGCLCMSAAARRQSDLLMQDDCM